MQRQECDGLSSVRERIADAARAAGRDVADIALVAVSKTQDAAAIAPVIAAGQRVFGENRVQEASGKWPALRVGYPDIRLHLVGALQSNKVKDAVALFDRIESVDRASLVDALAKRREKGDALPSLLMQVNVGEEPQKSGAPPAEAEAFAAWAAARGVHFDGVMGVPPASEDPTPYFALLRSIRDRLGLSVLSMGMSGDFETAIAFGATDIRVGSAIFGARPRADALGVWSRGLIA